MTKKVNIDKKIVRKTINLIQSWETSEEGNTILKGLHASMKKNKKPKKRKIGFDPSRIK